MYLCHRFTAGDMKCAKMKLFVKTLQMLHQYCWPGTSVSLLVNQNKQKKKERKRTEGAKKSRIVNISVESYILTDEINE